jgi:hypothetical protein
MSGTPTSSSRPLGLLPEFLRLRLLAARERARTPGALEAQARGAKVAAAWAVSVLSAEAPDVASENRLQKYFDANTEGPGIWKWLHYFEFYDRHLGKFVGLQPTVVEVGVYSGGSLPMWQAYFGPGCTVHGVDIEPACKAYESEGVEIHIGDQADRDFWSAFRTSVPDVDVLIDDGGHEPEQQMATLEELLPHLRPGGVYICEDVHGVDNRFALFAHALTNELNAFNRSPAQDLASVASPFQGDIHSIHFYPFAVVIEKRARRAAEFSAPKHGTSWQPFL